MVGVWLHISMIMAGVAWFMYNLSEIEPRPSQGAYLWVLVRS